MRRTAALSLAFLILSTACSGDRPTFEESAAREVDPVEADDGIAAGTEAGVVETLTLRLAVQSDWTGDPAEAGPASLTTRVLSDLLFEGLIRLDSSGQPEAGLAERWFVSDDRLIWTFVLPAELVDGAGEPVAARDIKQSLERVAARGTADQAASALTSVTGWADFIDGTTGGVAGIAAPDATTLIIRLDSPFELLLDVLASPAYGITGGDGDGGLRTTGAFRTTDDPNGMALVLRGLFLVV